MSKFFHTMKRFLAHAKYSCCTVLSKSNENELRQIWPIVLAKYRQTFAEISPGETKFRQNGGGGGDISLKSNKISPSKSSARRHFAATRKARQNIAGFRSYMFQT